MSDDLIALLRELFALSGSKDMAEFVRQALRNLEEIAR